MTAATDVSATDDAIGSCSICTVPNTNDWYVTTQDGIPLGPYRSREEAEAILALLCRRAATDPTGTDR